MNFMVFPLLRTVAGRQWKTHPPSELLCSTHPLVPVECSLYPSSWSAQQVSMFVLKLEDLVAPVGRRRLLGDRLPGRARFLPRATGLHGGATMQMWAAFFWVLYLQGDELVVAGRLSQGSDRATCKSNLTKNNGWMLLYCSILLLFPLATGEKRTSITVSMLQLHSMNTHIYIYALYKYRPLWKQYFMETSGSNLSKSIFVNTWCMGKQHQHSPGTASISLEAGIFRLQSLCLNSSMGSYFLILFPHREA